MPLSERALAAIERARSRSVSLDNPLLSDLPERFSNLRRHQVTAIEEIMAAYDEGARAVVVDAPTGSGKSLIGEVVRRLLGGSANYVATTKGLQDQFVESFPYAMLLKGRSNYPTESGPDEVTAADCTWSETSPCMWCSVKSRCPYEQAKKDALASPVAVLNTAYWLTETNGPGRFKNRGLAVFDEADTLESQLMSFVSVEITKRRMASLRLDNVEKVTVVDSWKSWIDTAVPKIRAAIPDDLSSVKAIKEANYLVELASKLRFIRAGLNDEYTDWVYTGREGVVSFKPARVDDIAPGYLWKNDKRFLLMSATVISPSEMMDSLGYDGRFYVVRVPSTFPRRNRRVVAIPAADVSRKGMEAGGLWYLRDAVEQVLGKHPGERVLVHTVSYQLTKELSSAVETNGRPWFTYDNAWEREKRIAEWLASQGGVLYAPSLERGLDLPDDACRVQIIAKVPFPYLGDRQVNARLYGRGGRVWYNTQTVRAIVQMTGRAVRHAEDHAVTYILDRQFGELYNRSRGLFPAWWREALEFRR